MEPLQIESISFSNFKALVNTTLPLGTFTLIVGPNGSGKSTALQAIANLRPGWANPNDFARFLSASRSGNGQASPQITVKWRGIEKGPTSFLSWTARAGLRSGDATSSGVGLTNEERQELETFRSRIEVYALDPVAIPAQVQLTPRAKFGASGSGLATVLDRMRDEAPARFLALNKELNHWLPEFDQVLFETPQPGHRAVRLRTSVGGYSIPASELSQGTMLALTMMTLAYLPNPPSLIGLEEPDRGIHPRLLRDVRDALYRLAYPEGFGETRPPVQVVATTQSPYFLDLFSEHPEEIVIAEKNGLEAEFKPLTDHGHIDEILAGASLGDIWYSGILGGVPGGT